MGIARVSSECHLMRGQLWLSAFDCGVSLTFRLPYSLSNLLFLSNSHQPATAGLSN